MGSRAVVPFLPRQSISSAECQGFGALGLRGSRRFKQAGWLRESQTRVPRTARAAQRRAREPRGEAQFRDPIVGVLERRWVRSLGQARGV